MSAYLSPDGDHVCWNYPQAFYSAAQDATYFGGAGSVNTPAAYPSALYISRYDHATGTITQSPPLDAAMGGDGHNSPAVIVIQGTGTAHDGKILCTWTGHNNAATMYVRRSTNANDITAWDPAISLTNDANDYFEYGALIQLANDHSGRIYRFYSGKPSLDTTGRKLRMQYSDDQGSTWSAYVTVVDYGNRTAYYLPDSNWVDRIDWATIDNAPSAGSTQSLYHFYMSVASNVLTYHKTDGTDVTAGLPLGSASLTKAFDGAVTFGPEQLDIAGNSGNPAILMQVPADSAAHDQRVRMVRWNGSSWVNGTVDITPLGDATPHEVPGQPFFTGFGCIDKYAGIDSVLVGYKASRAATGTVTLAASTTVTGSGTSFLSQVAAGSAVKFSIDGTATEYLVNAVASDTSLTLAASYAGTTGSGATMTARGWDIQRWATASSGASWSKAEDVTSGNLDYAHEPVAVVNAPSWSRAMYRSCNFIAYNNYKNARAYAYPSILPSRFAYDTFTGTSGSVLGNVHYAEQGGRWRQYSGSTNALISSAGRIYTSGTSVSTAYLIGLPATADCAVAADFVPLSFVAGDRNGITLRQDAGEAQTYYLVWFNQATGVAGGGKLEIIRINAGASSGSLASYTIPTMTAGNTYTVQATVRTTDASTVTVTATLNGTQVLSYADTSASRITATGYAGLRLNVTTASTNTAGQHIDNFIATDLSRAGAFRRLRPDGGMIDYSGGF